MLSNEFSKTAFGRRTLLKAITCSDCDNILSRSVMFDNAQNHQMLSINDDEMNFKANNETYIKWFEVKPQTLYFMTFTGKVNFPDWTDIHFGILDSEGYQLENRQTERELDFFIFHYGVDQQLTIKGQDGEWYERTYLFMSGSNNKMGFFAEGTQGCVTLKDIRIFEGIKAKNSKTYLESVPFSWQEPFNDCLSENNYLNDLSCFESAKNYGDFINKNQNKIEYNYNAQGYYYLMWLPIPEDNIFTFSYRDKVITEGNASYGFISQNANGKRKWLLQKNASKKHDFEFQADSFCVPKGNKVAFAVFDGGGKVEFSDFKVFLFGNGREMQ